MPDNPYGSDKPAQDPDLPNQTAAWTPNRPVDPQDPTMVAPIPPPAWSPSQPPRQAPHTWSPSQPPRQAPPAWSSSQPVPPPPPPPPAWSPSPPTANPGWQQPQQAWAPGWPQPNPGRKGPGLAVFGVIGALVLVVGLVLGAVLLLGKSKDTDSATETTAAPTTATPEPKITVAGLEDLLPTPATVSSALHISGAEAKAIREATFVLNDADRVSDMDCLGVPYVAQDSVYQGSGYTALRGRRLEKDGLIVDSAATTFPSSADATAFFTEINQKWQKCDRKALSRYFSNSDDNESWKIGTAEATDNTVKVLAYQEGGEGWACSHALGAKGNVTAEALVCGSGMDDEGLTLLNAMFASAAN